MLATRIRLRQYLLASTFALVAMVSGCTTTSSIPIGGACGSGSCGITDGGYGSGCTEGGCGSEVGCGLSGGECCDVPRELRKTALPEYRIEPPDVILIEAANHLRPASAGILAGEPLLIQVNRTLPSDLKEASVSKQFKTINGMYVIGTDGYINLGPEYGKVLCSGEPLQEIQRRVEIHLNRILKNPQVMVTLPDPTTKQIVAGPHLVRPDGTVGLGIYGNVFVAGMTMTEAKCAIEQHLSQHMHAPEVSLDVLGYNSKFYYVIADGGGAGESVTRIPCTGNETVLDAVSQVKGLPSVACKGQIWIARPAPECCRPDQLLHVDWRGIAEGAQTCTNYQMLPGDRLYVKADRFVTFDTNFAKITAPLERVLGFTILGNGTVRSLQQGSSGFGNNRGGF
jgi:polysaccharide biosynthesis/export protein